MKQIRKLLSLPMFARRAPAAHVPPVKALDEQQLRVVAGGGPNSTWRQTGTW